MKEITSPFTISAILSIGAPPTSRLATRQGSTIWLTSTSWICLSITGARAIAHPILSFDFGPQGHICFSIETRVARGQGYSPIAGLYRQYELIYIAADEGDVVRLRTNFKHEDIYLYRILMPQSEVQSRFLEYIDRLNQLHLHPAWYNEITENCTTTIVLSVRLPCASPGTGVCC